MSIFVFVCGYGDLFPLELTGFDPRQCVGCRFPVIWHQNDETQRLRTVRQQPFHVIHRRFHQFFAIRRMYLERPRNGFQLQERPSASKVGIRIGKCGTILLEIAIQRRRKTFKSDSEHSMEAFEDGDGERRLRVLHVGVCGTRRWIHSQESGVTLQEHPNARYEQLKLSVVKATVSIEVFLILNNIFVIAEMYIP